MKSYRILTNKSNRDNSAFPQKNFVGKRCRRRDEKTFLRCRRTPGPSLDTLSRARIRWWPWIGFTSLRQDPVHLFEYGHSSLIHLLGKRFPRQHVQPFCQAVLHPLGMGRGIYMAFLTVCVSVPGGRGCPHKAGKAAGAGIPLHDRLSTFVRTNVLLAIPCDTRKNVRRLCRFSALHPLFFITKQRYYRKTVALH